MCAKRAYVDQAARMLARRPRAFRKTESHRLESLCHLEQFVAGEEIADFEGGGFGGVGAVGAIFADAGA
jgi:hypothetical protein